MRARILFLALLAEGLRAASEARARGVLLAMHEFGRGDSFDLRFAGRVVNFERSSDRPVVRIFRDGMGFGTRLSLGRGHGSGPTGDPENVSVDDSADLSGDDADELYKTCSGTWAGVRSLGYRAAVALLTSRG
jgi:hypothetical protein